MVYLNCDVKQGLDPMHVAADRHGNTKRRVQMAARQGLRSVNYNPEYQKSGGICVDGFMSSCAGNASDDSPQRNGFESNLSIHI